MAVGTQAAAWGAWRALLSNPQVLALHQTLHQLLLLAMHQARIALDQLVGQAAGKLIHLGTGHHVGNA